MSSRQRFLAVGLTFVDVRQESKREQVLQEQEKKRQALALPNEMREDDQVWSCLRSEDDHRYRQIKKPCSWPDWLNSLARRVGILAKVFFLVCDVLSVQADLMFKRESAKGMGENEEAFDGAVDVNQTYWWHDKYRPRKPRYFNRVHTRYARALSLSLVLLQFRLLNRSAYARGSNRYDWNKYNQTHYDHDNPPPKVVQGYKFNVRVTTFCCLMFPQSIYFCIDVRAAVSV